MPQLEPGARNKLSGRAGMPTAFNETLIGRGAIGPWVFIGRPDAYMGGQECDENGCRAVIRNSNNETVHRMVRPDGVDIAGAFRQRGGGGRFAAMGPGGVADTARAIEQDRNVIAIGDDGMSADVVYQQPTSIRITNASGQQVALIQGMTWSNGDDYEASLRDGILAHLLDKVGWVLFDVTKLPADSNQAPQPVQEYAMWPGYVPIYSCVPVRDPEGNLWLMEMHELYLTMRRPHWTRGHIVAWHDGTGDNIGELYGSDVRLYGGAFCIAWSGNVQEDTAGDQDFMVDYTVAQLLALPYVTFEAPVTPVNPAPPIEPPVDPQPPTGELVQVLGPGLYRVRN